MSHGMRPGQGSWGRLGAGWSVLPPWSLHLPFGFLLLRPGVLLGKGKKRSKRSEAGQPHTFISSQEQPVRDGLGSTQGAQTYR